MARIFISYAREDGSDIVEKMSNTDLSKLGVEVIVDGRNCLDRRSIQSQDILYRGIGR